MNPDSPSQTPGQVNSGATPFTSTPPDQTVQDTTPAPSEQPNLAEVQGQVPPITETNTTVSPTGNLSEAEAGTHPLQSPPVTATPLGEVARSGGVENVVHDVADTAEQVADDAQKDVQAEVPTATKDAESVVGQVSDTLKSVESKLKNFGSAELTLVKRKLEEAEMYAQKHLQNTQK